MDQDENNEMLQDFLEEGNELLQEYESQLLAIEASIRDPSFAFEQIEEGLNALFRSVHTLKSMAGLMEFHDLQKYAHTAEEILEGARSNQITYNDRFVNQMFHVLETIQALIHDGDLRWPGVRPRQNRNRGGTTGEIRQRFR